tara:strand:+ start:146 stop:1801 length:1656 start_codon:yes stop_codon:yes gene_type:complete
MSKNSKVLALKYRPQVFEDLIGQELAVKTILNSIKENKVPNAYLFTGIRGVGKTTIARIVAKSINCKNGIENIGKKVSCDNCHCEAIANSNHIDVLEMDAASKTSVDDVRELIEFSRYGPSSAKYKIFIIDEVHMLSKQAFNALLKTLEEPPQYLKFIFATTEVKKIPITVLSRCQRFELPRVKPEELLVFLKKILNLENGVATDDALKLIIKLSEGSVRDALSLLDRALISLDKKKLDLEEAQKIFGYFDKTLIIELFNYLFKADEDKVLKLYKKIYLIGVDPKVFLNDFLEVLYYLKNINFLKLDKNNFYLNPEEIKNLSEIAFNIEESTLLNYWQFTINAMQELEVVSDQNIAIEMFLIRLLHLKEIKEEKLNDINKNYETSTRKVENDNNNLNLSNNISVKQIKNFSQEEQLDLEKKNIDDKISNEIQSFDELIEICNKNKELKLKYELETNVNLVRFESQLIEISFNENLDKNFVKDLSEKLFDWTSKRWIITFSKKKGMISKKQNIKEKKDKLILSVKNDSLYKKITDLFPDSELINVIEDNKDD